MYSNGVGVIGDVYVEVGEVVFLCSGINQCDVFNCDELRFGCFVKCGDNIRSLQGIIS